MADAPRSIISDISVDRTGDWYSGKSKIINTNVLAFFKKNLFCDINGIFIYNQLGSKSEKAYIKVSGPVLKVVALVDGQFMLDTEERVDAAKKELAMDIDERIYIVIDRLKAWAVFTREAMAELGDRLVRKNNTYFWNDKPIRVLKEIPWFFG
jgi:hypothetical protein